MIAAISTRIFLNLSIYHFNLIFNTDICPTSFNIFLIFLLRYSESSHFFGTLQVPSSSAQFAAYGPIYVTSPNVTFFNTPYTFWATFTDSSITINFFLCLDQSSCSVLFFSPLSYILINMRYIFLWRMGGVKLYLPDFVQCYLRWKPWYVSNLLSSSLHLLLPILL